MRVRPGVEGVDRDDLAQPVRQPRQAVEVRTRGEPRAVHGEQATDGRQGRAVERVGEQEPRDVVGERRVQVGEASPRRVPGVVGCHRERGLLAAVEVPADLGMRTRSRCPSSPDVRRVAAAARPTPPPEGDERRPGGRSGPPRAGCDGSCPRAGRRLEQGHTVPGTGEQGGGGEATDPTSDDDDTTHTGHLRARWTPGAAPRRRTPRCTGRRPTGGTGGDRSPATGRAAGTRRGRRR